MINGLTNTVITKIVGFCGDLNMIQTKAPISVIMKTTNNCNLGCLYCYEGSKRQERMSGDVVKATLEKIATESLRRSDGQKTSAQVIWHGGEPLLLGQEFYQEALRIQRKFELITFYNAVQSNLTLLTDDWINFFKENYFRVGGSLDGSKCINDLSRPMKGGGSSFDKILKNLKRAKKEGLNIGVICVIGKHNYHKLDELYDFFKKEGIDFEANPLTIDGFARNNKEEIAITPEELGEAINYLFDKWFNDKVEPIIGNSGFLKYSIALLTGKSAECVYTGNCSERYLSITVNGDVYPCGRFGIDTPEFRLGNILFDDIESLFQAKPRLHLAKRTPEQIEECVSCEYKRICKGGCPYSALLGFGDVLQRDYFCEGYKKIFKHIESAVESEIKALG